MTSIGRESAVKTLRIFNPHPGIFSYYDGRTGQRYFSEKRNWLDDGAFVLGISTYSVVSGNEALIYDAHITSDHAHAVVRHLRGLGVNKMTVVYSHSHNDHIAGAQAFGDTTIIGQERTASTLEQARDRLAQEEPPITVVLPTKLYSTQMTLEIGDITIELRNFDIHTADGTVLWIPSQRLLLAGDTLEDTITYISDPATLPTHQRELRRMAGFPIEKILPAHGSPERIAAGGYDPSFIDATLRYIAAMVEPVEQPSAWTKPLSEVMALDLSKGNLIYHAEYEEVHKSNIELIRKWRQKAV